MELLSRHRLFSNRRLMGAAAGSLVAVVALMLPVWPALRVEVDGDVAGHLAVSEDDRFRIVFLHSVDDLPVQDLYVVRDGRIVQEATRMRQYGAGMGDVPGQGRGHAVGRWWEVHDMNRAIGDLLLRVGSTSVDHRLRYADRELALSSCWAGRRMAVRPVRVSTLTRVLSSVLPIGCHA